MDGWMDGEVLIIGMMVGWSGRVLGLRWFAVRCGGLQACFFGAFFWTQFFSYFFDVGSILRSFGRPERRPTSSFQPFFFGICFERALASILGGFLEPRNLTNQEKPLFLSMVFVNFH